MQQLHANGSVRGSTSPWWVVEAPPDAVAPALEGTVDADVAVIGGGLTGLWTARALGERGVSAVVLEAETCGAGASARNGGFLHGYWSSLGRLRDAVGADAALETARAADGAIAAVARARRGRLADARRAAPRLGVAGARRAHPRRVALAAELGVPDEAVAVEPAQHLRSPVFRTARAFPGRCDGAAGEARGRAPEGRARHEQHPVSFARPGRVRHPRGEVARRRSSSRRTPGRRGGLRAALAVFRSAIVLTAPVPTSRSVWLGARRWCVRWADLP